MKMLKKGMALLLLPLLPVLIIAGLFLTGHIGPGFDRKLDTTSDETYKKSLQDNGTLFFPNQVEAFNWAVEGETASELIARYPSSSAREILKGEIERKSVSLASQKKQQEQAMTDQKPLEDDLAKIKTGPIESAFSADFFGPIHTIKVTVINQSKQTITKAEWDAKLFLDSGTTPTAEMDMTTSFPEGLKPQESKQATFRISSFGFDHEDWRSDRVRQSRNRRIELSLKPYSIEGMQGKKLLNPDLIVNQVNIIIQEALIEQHSKIAQAPRELCLWQCGPTKAQAQAETAVERPHYSSCSNRCYNGNCVRTLPDGRQERWQAERIYNSLSSEWEWDTNHCN